MDRPQDSGEKDNVWGQATTTNTARWRFSFSNLYLRILTAKLAWLEEKMEVALEGWKLLQARCLGKFLVLQIGEQ